MRRRSGVALAAVVVLAGCGSNRELVGNWTAVSTEGVPPGMERLAVPDDKHINLTNGAAVEYEVLQNDTVRFRFPSGEAYVYGYSRSGENLTLIDGKKKILFVRDQQ